MILSAVAPHHLSDQARWAFAPRSPVLGLPAYVHNPAQRRAELCVSIFRHAPHYCTRLGTIRREYLDRTLFWTSADLQD
jgi:hypothetical protein